MNTKNAIYNFNEKIDNYGYMSNQGEYYYFSYDGKVYYGNQNSKKVTEVAKKGFSERFIVHFFLSDGKLFYNSIEEITDMYSLFVQNLKDGNNKLIKRNANIITIFNNRIYFVQYGNNLIYSVDLQGNNKAIITENCKGLPKSYGEYIYYSTENTVFRYDLVKQKEELLVTNQISKFEVNGDYLYYNVSVLNSYTDFFRYNLVSKYTEKVIDGKSNQIFSGYFSIKNDKMFVDSKGIYMFDITNNKFDRILINVGAYDFYAFENTIIFMDENDKYYKKYDIVTGKKSDINELNAAEILKEENGIVFFSKKTQNDVHLFTLSLKTLEIKKIV